MTTPAERLAAALADRYRIVRELGQGGMATVFLAEDLKHDRKVAVKVLKPELAAVLGAERFVVEIKTTAALSHPHILPLFDSGEADGFLYYVMPYVEGETLRDRLNRETQLGVEEAVKITTEVADALHYAHGHGVIHRDIKPENILLQNGRPMVADFGIALAVSAAAGGRMTETGLSLGTPHYMSPEQATAEKEISGRSDVYSLASVLFEMLAGEPPHMGNSAQQIIMKIITDRARPVTELRQSVPPHVAAALAKALEKLPADRFDSAEAFAAALADRSFATSTAATAYRLAGLGVGGGGGGGAWRRVAAGAAIAAVLTAALMALVLRPGREVRRLVVTFPSSDGVFANGAAFRRFLPTRDGRHYVVVDQDGLLSVRSRDAEAFVALKGTEGAFYPTESPDGREIGFLSGSSSLLRVVPLAGGPVRILADSGVGVWGASWSDDGYIYVSSSAPTTVGILRIRTTGTASGAKLEQVTSQEESGGTTGHTFPVALPGGKGVLFTVQRGTVASDATIAVTRPGTGTHKELLRGTTARYSSTGHLLVLTADGSLVAAPFDLDALELTGDPVPVLQGVLPQQAFDGEGELHLTDDGTLWYQRGVRELDVQPVWVTRQGQETPVRPDWRGLIGQVAISPDGRRVAYSVSADGQERLWVTRLDGSGAPTLLEREGATNFRPSWSPDGKTLAWVSNRAGTNSVFARSVDGQETARRFLPPSVTQAVWEVSFPRSGPWVLYRIEANASDIYAFRPGVDSVGRPLRTTPATERQPTLSPDGRWIAYSSDEDGITNVYVRPFPNVEDAVWQVTTSGGLSPRWSRDGRELFYVETGFSYSLRGSVRMVALPLRIGESFGWGRPEQLFEMRTYVDANNSNFWDVSPTDGRFLMLRRATGGTRPDLVMVEHFDVELREKMRR